MEKHDDPIKKIETFLKGREVYTVKELIKLGIFGSKNAAYWAIEKGYITAVYITPHRLVILKDSLLKHLRKMNGG